MKNTKFTCVILITLLSINCLFGCGSQKQKPDFSSIKSVCELSTLKCYYHNVATYEKNAHGLLKVFGSGYKKIWIEYSGIVNLGIDINKVDISEPDTNNVITIKIPDAEVQSTSLDKSTLSEPETNCQGLFNQIHKKLQKRCQKHRMAPDTSFDRLHFSVQQVFAEIRIVWQLVDIWLPEPLDFG